jgi:hypothetical protein
MGTALGTALVLIVLGALIYPFLRGKYALPPDSAPERLRAQRLRVYRQIGDLEAARAAGEATDAEYRSQLLELRTAAARVLREEARLGLSASGEEQLERDIAEARKSRAWPPEGGDRV